MSNKPEISVPKLISEAKEDELRIMRMMADKVSDKDIKIAGDEIGVDSEWLAVAIKNKTKPAMKEALAWLRGESKLPDFTGSLHTFEGCVSELQRMLQAALIAGDRKAQLEVILSAATLHIRSGSKKTTKGGAPIVDFGTETPVVQRQVDSLMDSLEEPLVPGLTPIGSRKQEKIDSRFVDFIEEDVEGVDYTIIQGE